MKNASGDYYRFNINTVDDDLYTLAVSYNRLIDVHKSKDEIINNYKNRNVFDDIFKIGVDYIKTNNFNDAEIIFRSLIVLKPDGFGSYYNMGVIFAKKKDYINALTMFSKALQMNPTHLLTQQYISKLTNFVKVHHNERKSA